MTDTIQQQWEKQKAIKPGTILHDTFEDGVRFVVVQSHSHLCGYLGIPLEHPLAGFDYGLLSVDCHGGLTFGSAGDDKYLPSGYFWYGWDYGHSGDASYGYSLGLSEEKKWLVKDVVDDSWRAKYDFGKLMKLSEEIMQKGLGWKKAISEKVA